jgi:tetratricopeptide (TPR) repeat protein
MPIALTLALDQAGTYRDISELWAWARELAAEPGLRDHRLEAVVLGSAAAASWLLGDFDEAERLARRGLAVAEESGVDERLTQRCWSALAVVAMFRADFDTSRARWVKAAGLCDLPSSQLATAAMASGYAGDRETAARLLARAREANEREPSVGDRAYNHYAAGEIAADPAQAVREYTVARQLASSCGATFVEGLATVGLATVLTTTGDVAEAAGGFLMLLDYWPVTGNRTQLWTTLRNAALLLLDVGRAEAAALLLASADTADASSSVGGDSGSRLARAPERLAELLGPAGLAAVRARADSLGLTDVLGLARDELRRLAPPQAGVLTTAGRSTPGSGTGP